MINATGAAESASSRALPGERLRAERDAAVAGGMIVRELGADAPELLACRCRRYRRAAPPDHLQEAQAAPRDRHQLVVGQRQPEIDLRGGAQQRLAGIAEACRQHAGDRVGPAVEVQGLAERAGAGAEVPPPEGMAEDGDARRLAALVVARQQATPEDRPHAERREEVRRHVQALEPLGLGAAGQHDVPQRRDGGDPRERSRPLAEVEEILRRGPRLLLRLVDQVRLDRHQPAGGGERQAAELDGVDQREDGGVDPDPEGEGRQCDARESRAVAQQPQGMAEVAQHSRPRSGPRRRHWPRSLPPPGGRDFPGAPGVGFVDLAGKLFPGRQVGQCALPRLALRGAAGDRVEASLLELQRQLVDDLGFALRRHPKRRQMPAHVELPAAGVAVVALVALVAGAAEVPGVDAASTVALVVSGVHML